MRPIAGKSPFRVAVAGTAAAVVVFLGVLVFPHGELRCTAVVDAARTFALESIEPGRFLSSLRDGRSPGGQRLIEQRVLLFERSDLVEMELAPGLEVGAAVTAGQTVAVVRSLHTGHRLTKLRAQRAALDAQRALLLAGGAAETVAEAERAVEVIEAEFATARAELERIRLLNQKGLASAEELEVAELNNEVVRLRVALARSAVAVARSPARPESLAELDSRLAAVDAGIAELARLQDEEQVTTPVDGVVEVAAGGTELRIHHLDPAYLDIPIPAAAHSRIRIGAPVLFTTAAVPGTTFSGAVVEVAESAATAHGLAVFWASASVDNPDRLLRFGMTGTVYLPLDSDSFGSLAALRRKLWGRWT